MNRNVTKPLVGFTGNYYYLYVHTSVRDQGLNLILYIKKKANNNIYSVYSCQGNCNFIHKTFFTFALNFPYLLTRSHTAKLQKNNIVKPHHRHSKIFH